MGQLANVSESLQPLRDKRAAAMESKAAALREAAAKFAWGRSSRLSLRPGAWHQQRAGGLRRPVLDRCKSCCAQSLPVVDCTTGETREVPIGCKQALCRRCERTRARAIQRRIIQSLEFVAAVERDAGREIPVMLTLTVRHPTARELVNPALDAEVMRRAWILFRSRWHYAFGYAFKMFRFEELSAGKEKGGHLHWHIVTFWHRFDWQGTFQRWWSESVFSARCELDPEGACALSGPGLDGSWQSAGNVDVQIYTAAKAAAVNYAAKLGKAAEHSAAAAGGYASPAAAAVAYATPTGEGSNEKASISSDIHSEKTAAYLNFVYGKRRFQASRGILPKESTCNRFYVAFLFVGDQDQELDGS